MTTVPGPASWRNLSSGQSSATGRGGAVALYAFGGAGFFNYLHAMTCAEGSSPTRAVQTLPKLPGPIVSDRARHTRLAARAFFGAIRRRDLSGVPPPCALLEP